MVAIKIILLAFFIIITAVIAFETEKISRGLVSLALSAVGIGATYYVVGATYAALFQFLLYAGVLIALIMVVAASFTEKSTEEVDKTDHVFRKGHL